MNNTPVKRLPRKQSSVERSSSVETVGCQLENGQDEQETCRRTDKTTDVNGGPSTPTSPRTPGHGVTGTTPMSPPPVSPKLDRWIRQRCRDLTLRRVDTQRAAKIVNHLRDGLLEFLKNNQERPYFRQATVLNSGSYFEMVKINSPNEFDMMLILPTPRLTWTDLDDCPDVFYTVSLSRPTRSNEIRSYLLQDQRTISAARIRADMRDLVCNFISTYEVPPEVIGHWKVCEAKEDCPAVTLELLREDSEEAEMSIDIVPTLEVTQGWPDAARKGPNVDNWLGKNTRRKFVSQPFYFVPKTPKGNDLSEMSRESWRISFSHIEKDIILKHGNRRTCCEGRGNRCCRKSCLRLLKRLIEGLKQRFPEELEPLCSYHGKTAFFHALSRRGDDTQWAVGNLSSCFLFLLDAFEGHAQSGLLTHFFVPSHNLFAPPAFPQGTLDFLVAALKEQRESNLPFLQTPAPAPPLNSSPSSVQLVPLGSASVTESWLSKPKAVMFTVLMAVVLGLCFI
ncbi:hypothetical protein ACEWY4_024171 [Coilia grayii]|uniref:Cyclic GMP-AMP synthase n=1 Tax=Coilia grayii TaxID=363190 RepID=A0ABD1IZL3_9TELE